MNTLLSKDTLNWSNETENMFIMLQMISISNKCFNYLAVNPDIMVSTKTVSSIIVFNTDNNKKRFFSNKSAY